MISKPAAWPRYLAVISMLNTSKPDIHVGRLRTTAGDGFSTPDLKVGPTGGC